ncbi:hypothetical protein [Myxococcus sp. RHSTA-1-4]|uniref:hypothetical protein n=1 Tax=Myxococcus sp. RHSTA-1-4 TaxID=2874601 RepID=UPI001CBAC46E|nr:hypothetical protein [Myxococcus sp. RHSTA-1-4]MBZ4422789.1 hypothetical protein [Myxococcus sp. RHSTA-1-4]
MPLPLPIPVNRYLVPGTPPRLPADMTRVRVPLVRGLPQPLPLDGELELVLYAPLGQAVLIREADPTALVGGSEPEDTRHTPVPAATRLATAATQALARAPARLVVRMAGTIAGVLPLAAGLWRAVPDGGGAPGARLEVVVLGWALHVGTLRGAGDFGSFVELAWRRADAGAARFVLPRLQSRVAARFQGIIQSELGVEAPEEPGP